MRGLFFKIFIIFWIAQSLIFVISMALIVRHRFPSPDILRASLFSTLQNESQDAVSSYETVGCRAVQASALAHGHSIAIETDEDSILCTTGAQGLFRTSRRSGNEIYGDQVGGRYIWNVPINSATGRRYVVLLSIPHTPEVHTWYQDLLHFAFPQLPVAIAVGGATTFVLVLVFTRPVIRLRKAARDLARGNLATRVRETSSVHIFRGDEFHALIHDFNHMAERLEGLVGAQKLLLRDVSHELRSPLARLSVALELAREDAHEGMTSHLDRIERETARLNQLIGQLLTLSSMEAIEADDFEPVSLKGLLEEMIPDAEYEARQRQTSIVLDANDECVIQGKRELLYRAIENVVRNAIRYTEPGTEVAITLSASKAGVNGTAVLQVADHGPGIPEAEIQSIFRPFYRVDEARSPHTGGFGVGLAIAERAVKLHHGEVGATNCKGGGAEIQMRFPLAVVRSIG
jgi:two-component system sensor histidine kinase CpxA